MEYQDYQADTNTEENIPQETWRERRARLEAAYDAAEQAYFSHRDKIGYLRISPLPQVSRSELLRCHKHRLKAQATHYQTTPIGVLYCTPCAKAVMAQRRKEWLARKRWKEQTKNRAVWECGLLKTPANR